MVEQELGPPSRVFHISEKTPHAWLVAQKYLHSSQVRSQIASDIIGNAQELEDRVDWNEVLSSVRWVEFGGNIVLHGKQAISKSIARQTGRVAKHMGWDMHSPEVVYMSGHYIFVALCERVERLEANLRRADERTFLSEEAREKVFLGEREEADRLSIFKKRLGESLETYVRQKLPNSQSYLAIFEKILHVATRKRQTILCLLKSGKIDEAYALLEKRHEPHVKDQP